MPELSYRKRRTRWRKRVSALYGVLVAMLGCSASADLIAEKNPLDLGVIEQGLEHVSAVFVLTNDSASKSITIESLKTTCGCSEATVDTHTIPPKGSTELTVVLDLMKVKAGPFRKIVYVQYGEEEATEHLELTFIGAATPQAFYLAQEIGFGAVRRDGIVPKTVYLNRFLKGAQLREVVVSDPLLLVQPTRDPESKEIVAKIAFKKNDLPFGEYRTYMVLKTDDEHYPRVNVPVTITLLQPRLFDVEDIYLSAKNRSDTTPITILLEDGDIISDLRVDGLPAAIEHTIQRDDASRPTQILLKSANEINRNIVGVMTITCTLNGDTRTTRIPYYIRGQAEAARR